MPQQRQSSGDGSMRKLFAALTLVLLVGIARTHAELVNENLLVTVPPGYKIDFQDKKPNSLMNEMVPTTETVNNWTEMVTVQIFYNMKATPEQFVDKMASGWKSACPGATSSAIASGPENGYPSGVWLLNCPKNPGTGKPEITWIKAVQGNDSFYVVQKAFKFTPSKDEVVQWMKYLHSIAVCDSRLADSACPQTKD
jgi:hypothetical protein